MGTAGQHRCRRAVGPGAAALLVVLLGACSGQDSLPPAVLVANPVTTTAELATTTVTTLAEPADDATTTTSEALAPGLDAGAVFDSAAPGETGLELLALGEADLATLERRFSSDERLAPYLSGVDARAVRRDGVLSAVVLSVAVEPVALTLPGFTDSFVDGATSGGTVNPIPERLGPASLTTWIDDDAGHMLWRHENLFVVFSGRDLLEVRSVAGVIVAGTLGLDVADVIEVSTTTTAG